MIVQVQVCCLSCVFLVPFLKDRPAWILGTSKVQQNDVASVLSVFLVSQLDQKWFMGWDKSGMIGYGLLPACLISELHTIIILLDSMCICVYICMCVYACNYTHKYRIFQSQMMS